MSQELNTNETLATVVPTAETLDVMENVKLLVPVPEKIETIEFKSELNVAYVEIPENDAQAYGQISLLTKEAKNIKFVGSAKAGFILIPAGIENNESIKRYVNPAFDHEALLVHVSYGDFARLKISVKNTGGGTVKKSEKAAFYDRVLDGVIENEGAQYIYGTGTINGVEFSKYNNTLIARLVKNIFPDHRLYSDENKLGFHKTGSRMPKDGSIRTTDNYSFYIRWDEIISKIDAFNAANPEKATLSGKETVARILEIIDAVYPGVEISTEKNLNLECLKSLFNSISREKFVVQDGVVVSKAKEEEELKLQRKLEKEKAKNEAANNAKIQKAQNLSAQIAAAPGVTANIDLAAGVALGALGEAADVADVAEEVKPIEVTPVQIAPVGAPTAAPVFLGMPTIENN